MEVLFFSLQLALGLVVPALVLRRDIRHLPPRALERAWPDTSVWVAVVLLGPLSVSLHLFRTRRTLLSAVMAVAWAEAWVLGPLFVLSLVEPG